ncbi:MAG: FkbM family methyltransferase [Deltaproteobacteria bacterium]|nr:FkbM family methyltransferase [Deltaproteobacteria bacterium]
MPDVYVSWDGFRWFISEPWHTEVLGKAEIGVLRTLYSLAREDYTFVDVGAGLGYYAVRMSKRVKRVHAFEPNPSVRRILSRNLELNGCENVKVWPVALGVGRGALELHIDKLSSSLLPRRGAESSVAVEVVSMDELFITPNIIKIDVEGYELEVLRGAEGTLKLCAPYVLVEHHDFRPDWAEQCKGLYGKCEALMARLGYVPLVITDVHRLWVPKVALLSKRMDELKYALWRHYVNLCFKNLQEGRAWYHGLPKTWWWGMCLVDFIEELPEHIEKEADWAEAVIE